jgi:hypothetical protein
LRELYPPAKTYHFPVLFELFPPQTKLKTPGFADRRFLSNADMIPAKARARGLATHRGRWYNILTPT